MQTHTRSTTTASCISHKSRSRTLWRRHMPQVSRDRDTCCIRIASSSCCCCCWWWSYAATFFFFFSFFSLFSFFFFLAGSSSAPVGGYVWVCALMTKQHTVCESAVT